MRVEPYTYMSLQKRGSFDFVEVDDDDGDKKQEAEYTEHSAQNHPEIVVVVTARAYNIAPRITPRLSSLSLLEPTT